MPTRLLTLLFLLAAPTLSLGQPNPNDPIDVRSAPHADFNIPHYAVDPYTQIRIRYADGWHVTIWAIKDGTRLGVVNGFNCTSQRTYLFVGPPGDYLAHAINSDGNAYQELITIRPSPGPDPPGPDPPDPPGPNPPNPPGPVPSEVPNTYGIGHPVYLVSKPLPKAQVQELASLIQSLLTQLARNSITPTDAQTQIRQKRESFGPEWASWERSTEAAVSKATEKYGTSVAAFLRYYDELARAMTIATR